MSAPEFASADVTPAVPCPEISGHGAWFLALVGLNAVRRRIEREGLTVPVAEALAERIAELTKAAHSIDRERTTTVDDSARSAFAAWAAAEVVDAAVSIARGS